MPGAFLAGHVLIQSRRRNTRAYRSIHARSLQRPPQWTLHRTECFYVTRAIAAEKLPAPIKPYPHTVACTMCRPDAEKET
jgi:hypothetical protein